MCMLGHGVHVWRVLSRGGMPCGLTARCAFMVGLICVGHVVFVALTPAARKKRGPIGARLLVRGGSALRLVARTVILWTGGKSQPVKARRVMSTCACDFMVLVIRHGEIHDITQRP